MGASSLRVGADVKTDPDASPEAVKAKEWRYKLQRAFLSKGKSLPAASDMDQYDDLLKTIEGEEMTREVLKYSKLRKGESTGVTSRATTSIPEKDS